MAEFLSYNVKITQFSRDPGKKCPSFLTESLEKPGDFVPETHCLITSFVSEKIRTLISVHKAEEFMSFKVQIWAQVPATFGVLLPGLVLRDAEEGSGGGYKNRVNSIPMKL